MFAEQTEVREVTMAQHNVANTAYQEEEHPWGPAHRTLDRQWKQTSKRSHSFFISTAVPQAKPSLTRKTELPSLEEDAWETSRDSKDPNTSLCFI